MEQNTDMHLISNVLLMRDFQKDLDYQNVVRIFPHKMSGEKGIFWHCLKKNLQNKTTHRNQKLQMGKELKTPKLRRRIFFIIKVSD